MPLTPEEIAALTDAVAAAPSYAQVDGRSATAQRITDLIAYEKWRADQIAASTTSPSGIGVKFFNTSPPGAVSPLSEFSE